MFEKADQIWESIHSNVELKKITEFNQWLVSDNVIIKIDKFGRKFYTSQDAQYNNRMYTKQEAFTYYLKEFHV